MTNLQRHARVMGRAVEGHDWGLGDAIADDTAHATL